MSGNRGFHTEWMSDTDETFEIWRSDRGWWYTSRDLDGAFRHRGPLITRDAALDAGRRDLEQWIALGRPTVPWLAPVGPSEPRGDVSGPPVAPSPRLRLAGPLTLHKVRPS